MYEKIEFADVKVGDRVRVTLTNGDVFEGKVEGKSANCIGTVYFDVCPWDTQSIERERKPLEPGVYESYSRGIHSYLAVFPDGSLFFTASGGRWVTADEKSAQAFDWEKG